jgi:hypothetical protein
VVPLLVLLSFGVGCSTPKTTAPREDEGVLRQAFTALQEALKAKDADKLWDLLDADSQADAERAAESLRKAYAEASEAEKAEQAKNLGVKPAGLAKLTGKGFLRTRRFLGKYDEIPGSKVEKVTVQGDSATVNYLEPDGDKEKLKLVRQKGAWKVSLRMP